MNTGTIRKTYVRKWNEIVSIWSLGGGLAEPEPETSEQKKSGTPGVEPISHNRYYQDDVDTLPSLIYYQGVSPSGGRTVYLPTRQTACEGEFAEYAPA